MFKRMFDLAICLPAAICLAPVMLLIALLIKLSSRGPVFYRGERVGRYGKSFRIFKFRTMVVDAESQGPSSTSEDDPRITRVGHFIRRFKLDELPQLLNVIVGDMSLVGPRPQVRWAVDRYNQHERRLLDVRPGITDYASLEFRNEGEILKGHADPDEAYLRLIAPEKIRLGLKYVETNSVWIDLKIIFATIAAIFLGVDFRAEGLDGKQSNSGRVSPHRG